MNNRFYLCCIAILLCGCLNNKAAKESDKKASIHKVWEFEKMAKGFNDAGTKWIGKNRLDLTNKDTLKFNYSTDKIKPTIFPYHISHDTIFAQNNAIYKIVKLTDSLLYLGAFAKTQDTSLMIMVYRAKK